MPIFNIHAAKTQFSKLVEDAVAGEEIVIAKAGVPVAKLVPFEQPKRPLGLLRGIIDPDRYAGPLSDEEIDLFEGR